MKKIPTVFVRDPDNRRYVLPEISPGCEWVFSVRAVATRKYDGTCCMYDGYTWWARREVKPDKNPPLGFSPVETDETTGKTVGWEPIEQSPFAKFHTQAKSGHDFWPTGTYELCGPKINGNPEELAEHTLIKHSTATQAWVSSLETFDDIRDFLDHNNWEGIVFHHQNGSMAKIKYRDFRAC